MYFLWFISDWLSSVGASIMGAVEHAVRTLSFSLVKIIYGLIIFLYDWFEALCTTRLLSTEVLKSLSSRIGLILGIIMFFIVVFSLIKMLIDPDKINDKEVGAASILKKFIIVIVLLGVSNYIFNALYYVQRTVVKSHVISNLLLPYKISDEHLEKFGNILSSELLMAFYRVNEFEEADVSDNDFLKVNACINNVKAFKNQITSEGKFSLGYNCLNESVEIQLKTGTAEGVRKQDDYIVDYDWLLIIVAGGFTAWMLFMYCFKIGLRMVQLMFLEIISPLAIVSYMMPKKDTMFDKWLKIYIATYLDVFIRIVIINFVVFLIATIFDTTANGDFRFWTDLGGKPTSSGSVAFLTVVIILALLTFAKKAPELLKELLPAGASKLGFGLSMKDVVGLSRGINTAVGVGTGAAVGLIGGFMGGKKLSRFTGAIGGILGGSVRGIGSGWGAKNPFGAMSSARTNQAKANLSRAQRIAGGGHWYDSITSGVMGGIGMIDPYTGLESQVSSYSDLKADIEGEDVVKNALSSIDVNYQKYVDGGGNLSKTEWLDKDGEKWQKALDEAKNTAWRELYKKKTSDGRDSAFKVKVDMHNRRFGTNYDIDSKWVEKDANGRGIGINDDRKSKAADLERRRAQKPSK